MQCPECGHHEAPDDPRYYPNCGFWLSAKTVIRIGADAVGITDEDGKVRVKPFKTRDELKAILGEHNVDGIPFEVGWGILNPLRRWRKKTP